MSQTSAVILAPDFEEIEAVSIIDVLRRAALPVMVAGLGNKRTVRGSHGMILDVQGRVEDLNPDALAWTNGS